MKSNTDVHVLQLDTKGLQMLQGMERLDLAPDQETRALQLSHSTRLKFDQIDMYSVNPCVFQLVSEHRN